MDWALSVLAAADGGLEWLPAVLAGAIALGSAVVLFMLGQWAAIKAFNRQAKESERIRAAERPREDAARRDSERIAALGMLGHEMVDVRLGGLFSLERLAVDEPERFAANVYESLVAYLREHTLPKRYDLTDEERAAIKTGSQEIPHIETDIEAVLTILGRHRGLFDDIVDHLPTDAGGDGPHLVGVNLSGRWLRGANFNGAPLTDCRLGEAILTDCSFEEATLTGCSFDKVPLTDCRFREATFTDCTFYKATVTGCSFEKTTLTDCLFYRATLTGCRFEEATLTGCHFDKAILTDCSFYWATLNNDCRFEEATLNGCHFYKATLTDCSFYKATLADCSSYKATLTHCSFDEVLTDCRFNKATLTHCTFHKATLLTDCIFYKATLADCGFVYVSWDPEHPLIWPPGFDPPPNTWEGGGHDDPAPESRE